MNISSSPSWTTRAEQKGDKECERMNCIYYSVPGVAHLDWDQDEQLYL